MNYFFRPREDGKYDVLEGTPDTPGRIVTCFDTMEDAAAYIADQNVIFDELFNRIIDLEDDTPAEDVMAAAEEDTVPYKLATKDGKTCVVKKSDGSVAKCYDDRDEAIAYLKSLYTNQADAIVQAAVDELDTEEVVTADIAPPDIIVDGNNITINGTTNPISTAIKVAEALQAHAELAGPPADFFSNPELPELQRWTTITEDGRVYGHSAGKDECHIGILDRCVTIDDIADGLVAGCDWEYSMPGHVVAADGTRIGTGPIPVKGGHADKSLDWIGALAHYDDPATVVADVVYGRDDFGIWFSGAIRPTATPAMVYALRASGVSLDAREVRMQLRYLTTCCVNTAGFPKADAPKPDARIAASGEIQTLIAIGGQPLPHPDLCDCKDATQDILDELDGLQRIVADAGLEDMVIEKLAARIPADDDEMDELFSRVDS